MDKRLTHSAVVLIICLIAVLISYFCLDKAVVFWAYQHNLRQYRFLDWFTKIPEFFTAVLLIIYPYLIIRYYIKKITYWEQVLFATANSVAIADFLHNPLKIVFGRYWPETWKDNNVSLLRNDAYGFNWFHSGTAYKSFPSGHTTVMVAVAATLWIAYPTLRWLIVLVTSLVIIGLAGTYYHFIGDIIAGATLGYLTAYHTANISGITLKKN